MRESRERAEFHLRTARELRERIGRYQAAYQTCQVIVRARMDAAQDWLEALDQWERQDRPGDAGDAAAGPPEGAD